MVLAMGHGVWYVQRTRSALKPMIVVLAAGCVTASASAQQDPEMREILALVKEQAREIAALKARLDSLHAMAPLPAEQKYERVNMTSEAVAAAAAIMPRQTTGFSVTPRGRMQVDGVVYDSEDGRSYRDGTGLRRARLGAQGTLPGDFSYQIEADFAPGDQVRLDDTFLRYNGFAGTAISIGFHKVHHGLNAATSDLDVTFIERSIAATTFDAGAGGKIGVSALSSGARWSVQYGVMFGSANVGEDGKDGWGVNARATYAPIYDKEKGKLLHIGVAGYYRNEDDDSVSFASRPELHHDSFQPFQSGVVVASNYTYVNAEMATTLGPLSLQGELARMYVSPGAASATVGETFWAAYAQASYFLTGESRPYNPAAGAFTQVHPRTTVGEGGLGAFELGVRFSHLDLAGMSQGSTGDTVTLGLNWYMTDAIRLMVNAVDFDTHGDVDAHGRSYGLRAQVRW
ncbi:OprO/OprP family phosphate-selective porin [Kordiimonas sp.]|uniref:OprO/OprP family phosphate-selective porin n=1 Tax=Kordiimonas sp. TaxID=1970157 RepID=UPI003A957186